MGIDMLISMVPKRRKGGEKMSAKSSMLSALKELASIDAYYIPLYQKVKASTPSEFKTILDKLHQSKQLSKSRYDTGLHSRDSLIYQDSVDALQRAITMTLDVH